MLTAFYSMGSYRTKTLKISYIQIHALTNGFKKTHSKDKNKFHSKTDLGVPKPANTSDRIFNDEAIYEEIERIKKLIIYESKI